ncbi:MAG: ABC transporter permease [Chloroflexota bacterium]
MATTAVRQLEGSTATPHILRQVWQHWSRIPLKVQASFLVFALLVILAIFPALLTTVDPNQPFFSDRLTAPFTNATYPLGTDDLGRDLVSRILYGGRASLMIGVFATLFGLVLGVSLGVIAGYTGKWVENIVMYLVDVQLSLPFLLLAIAIALVLGNSLTILIIIAGLATWPSYARVCRGVVLSLRELDYVTSARAVGAGPIHIIVWHILPGLFAPVMVIATISMGRVILIESSLSFLGIGIKPPTPSWGQMIEQGRSVLGSAWWVSTMPGIALTMLTMSIGTIGDWLRDVLDPTLSTS